MRKQPVIHSMEDRWQELMVVYTFVNEPELFTSYVAIDPSLWWDNRWMTKDAKQKVKDHSAYNNSLFIGGRMGRAYNYMGIDGFDSLMKEQRPAGLDYSCDLMKNETHYSTNFTGFWQG